MAGYVAESTENKFGPLTIKYLPTLNYTDTAEYCTTNLLLLNEGRAMLSNSYTL